MLHDELVQKVKELLNKGEYSQRAIAKLTGVSRVVVHRIATGKRNERKVKTREEWEVNWTGKPYRRCPVCGILTRLPCLACIIRRMATKNPSENEPLLMESKLELEERHRIRYEEIKTWREMQSDPNFTEIPKNWPFRKRWNAKKGAETE